MYTTPFTTAGDEKSTSLPNCASQSRVTNLTFCPLMVVSLGFTPVWLWSKRNWVQLTEVAAEARGAPGARKAATTSGTTTALARRIVALPGPRTDARSVRRWTLRARRPVGLQSPSPLERGAHLVG